MRRKIIMRNLLLSLLISIVLIVIMAILHTNIGFIIPEGFNVLFPIIVFVLTFSYLNSKKHKA